MYQETQETEKPDYEQFMVTKPIPIPKKKDVDDSVNIMSNIFSKDFSIKGTAFKPYVNKGNKL